MSNFKEGQEVLVRDRDSEDWREDYYYYICTGQGGLHVVSTCDKLSVDSNVTVWGYAKIANLKPVKGDMVLVSNSDFEPKKRKFFMEADGRFYCCSPEVEGTPIHLYGWENLLEIL